MRWACCRGQDPDKPTQRSQSSGPAKIRAPSDEGNDDDNGGCKDERVSQAYWTRRGAPLEVGFIPAHRPQHVGLDRLLAPVCGYTVPDLLVGPEFARILCSGQSVHHKPQLRAYFNHYEEQNEHEVAESLDEELQFDAELERHERELEAEHAERTGRHVDVKLLVWPQLGEVTLHINQACGEQPLPAGTADIVLHENDSTEADLDEDHVNCDSDIDYLLTRSNSGAAVASVPIADAQKIEPVRAADGIHPYKHDDKPWYKLSSSFIELEAAPAAAIEEEGTEETIKREKIRKARTRRGYR